MLLQADKMVFQNEQKMRASTRKAPVKCKVTDGHSVVYSLLSSVSLLSGAGLAKHLESVSAIAKRSS